MFEVLLAGLRKYDKSFIFISFYFIWDHGGIGSDSKCGLEDYWNIYYNYQY